MKKTYKTPTMFAVTMQNEDMLAQSITDVDGGGTGIDLGGESGEEEEGLVKGHSIWDNEW